MLQGNPFETQLVVQERTTRVRQDLAHQHRILASVWFKKAVGWWQSRRPNPDMAQPNLRSLEPIKDGR